MCFFSDQGQSDSQGREFVFAFMHHAGTDPNSLSFTVTTTVDADVTVRVSSAEPTVGSDNLMMSTTVRRGTAHHYIYSVALLDRVFQTLYKFNPVMLTNIPYACSFIILSPF